MLILKDILQQNLNVIKTSRGNEFDNLTNFPKDEMNKWMVIFISENEYHVSIVEQLGQIPKKWEEKYLH